MKIGFLLIFVLLLTMAVLAISCTPAEMINGKVTEIDNQIADGQQVNGQGSLPEPEIIVKEDTGQEEGTDAQVEESNAIENEIENPVEAEAGVLVTINKDGFSPEEITVKVGERVKFVNNRAGNLKKALVIGNRQCVNMKSPVLNPGDTFEWTFEEAQTCTVVDAITTTQIMTITVE